MKKLNTEEVSLVYNKVREANVGKKFTNKQVIQLLVNAGLSSNLAIKMVANSTLFNKCNLSGMGRGKHVAYIFSYNPIYKDWFKNWLYPVKKEEKKFNSFEDECAEYLRKQGYQLKKCVGFDEDAFKKDYPQLWSKYLIYEEV